MSGAARSWAGGIFLRIMEEHLHFPARSRGEGANQPGTVPGRAALAAAILSIPQKAAPGVFTAELCLVLLLSRAWVLRVSVAAGSFTSIPRGSCASRAGRRALAGCALLPVSSSTQDRHCRAAPDLLEHKLPSAASSAFPRKEHFRKSRKMLCAIKKSPEGLGLVGCK